MLKRLIEFIKHGIWQKDESKVSGKRERWFVRTGKIIIYTVRGLGEHDVGIRAAALTFFTLMSIVPIAALIFGVIKGFGLEDNLTEYLYGKFPQYSTVIDNILIFATNMLNRAKGGVVASVGFIVLFWAVIKVFGNIESTLNNIWDVKKQRSLARKFSDYVAVVVVAPILWLVSSGLATAIRTRLEYYTGAWIVDILFGILSMMALWLMFAFIYYVMPNTRVKFKGALIAGVIAGTVFQLFQIIYVFVQSYITSYNVIYGSFAALPLFLIWLQASWMILLVGAELSFAYQNITTYEQERESLHISYDRRKKIMLSTMVIIADHFLKNQGPVDSQLVAEELNMPVRIVRDVIFDLEKAGLVMTVKSDNDKVNLYVPARDVHTITVFDVIDGVESSSSIAASHTLEGNDKVSRVSEILDDIKHRNIDSPLNVNITQLINPDK